MQDKLTASNSSGSNTTSNTTSSSTSDSSYGPDSLVNVFSSGKSLTSLVIAMLADRGHLRYDQRIVDIWPAFAFGGDTTHPDYAQKASITVAMLMRHEAGMPRLTGPRGSCRPIAPLKLSDLTPHPRSQCHGQSHGEKM